MKTWVQHISMDGPVISGTWTIEKAVKPHFCSKLKHANPAAIRGAGPKPCPGGLWRKLHKSWRKWRRLSQHFGLGS
jgi:hypothetical protein